MNPGSRRRAPRLIAPLRQTDPTTGEIRRRLREARLAIVETFWGPQGHRPADVPVVAPWRAWLLAAWVVIVLLGVVALERSIGLGLRASVPAPAEALEAAPDETD
jgi:hypothetical protein